MTGWKVAVLAVVASSLAAASPAFGQAAVHTGAAPASVLPPPALAPAASAGLLYGFGEESRKKAPALLHAAVLAPDQRPGPSVAGYTAAGAVAGALAGVAVLYLANGDNCTETGSMCGIGIPLYAGAGALGGGVLGYLIGRARN